MKDKTVEFKNNLKNLKNKKDKTEFDEIMISAIESQIETFNREVKQKYNGN